ncbi:AraC family transcriptional regulator [Clostridium sp. AF19-22AC]|nr:AraC family transcriptional regulator [Clostridium sp. AF19-22AC]
MEKYRTKLMLFEEMACCCHNFYFWEYNKELELIKSSCQNSEAFNQCFQICFRQADFSDEIFQSPSPIIVSSSIQMMWIAIPYLCSPENFRLHVLGPFFISDVSSHNLDLNLLRKGLPKTLRQQIVNLSHTLPLISWNHMIDYTIMMAHCISDSQISSSDIRFFTQPETNAAKSGLTGSKPYTAHGTYHAEQKMLQMVREGNLEIFHYLDTLSSTGEIGTLCTDNMLRQMQNSVEVSIVLFSRASIEGGLNPELAYNLADQYFQAVEGCHSLSELSTIANTMHRDFVERVHKCKIQQYSKLIGQCCDYITLHLEEDISISDLASLTGYSDYYCSKKFKKETGKTPAQYIKEARLKAAANLLTTSNEDIQEIAARYRFGSQSYFTDSFRRQYGMSPREYRLKSP